MSVLLEKERYYPKYRDQQEKLDVLFEMVRSGSALPSIDEVRDLWTALYYPHKLRDYICYEVLSREYIAGLGGYLAQRIEELGGTEENPLMILETGAGDGRLTHFLRLCLEDLSPGKSNLVATDKKQNWIPIHYPVEVLDYRKALQKYNPTIVIASWMPLGKDWTPAYRKTPSVQEYLLIGEPDGGVCGSFATWGEKPFYKPVPVPEYQKDGFEMVFLDQVTINQFLSRENLWSNSATVAFRRIAHKNTG